MSYSSELRNFAIYSEDFDLLGQNKFTVQAYMKEYTDVKSETLEAEIELIDPCLDPFSLVMPTAGQTTPDDYYYDGSLVFTTNKFTVDPSV